MTENDEQMHPAVRGLKTVCRCNNIKYRTIARAIREGAHTLTQIATRTTATTGHCGGSCTPDVQEMLTDLAPQRPLPVVSGEGWWVRRG
jgi:NAD(P)H-nitrite reductase large subunit